MEDLLALIEESPTLHLDEIVNHLAVIFELGIALHDLQALGLIYKDLM